MNSNNITFKNSPNQSIMAFSVKSQSRPSTTTSSSDTSTKTSSQATTTTTTSSNEPTTTSSAQSSSSPSPTPSQTSSSATSTQVSSTSASSSSSSSISASSTKPTSTPSSTSLAKPSSTTMPPRSKSPNHHQGLSHGAIAGIIVACVVAALLLLGLCFCLWYRKRKAQRQRISYHGYQHSEKAIPFHTNPRNSQHTLSNIKSNKNNSNINNDNNYAYNHYNNNSNINTSQIDDSTSQYNSITPFSAAAAATAITHNNSTKETFESANNYSNSMLSSPANGTTTPVIDEDFWQNQKPLGTYTIISSYTQTLDDELYIQPGDKVQVYTEYDDGWCLGINLSRGGERGVFPQHCLDKHIAQQADVQYE